MNGRKVIWLMRLPQIDPPFAEDQRWRDGCMMPPITWRQRLLRQIFPRRGVQDCCYYHGQDFHAIAASVIAAYRQVSRHNLEGEQAGELGRTKLDLRERPTPARALMDAGVRRIVAASDPIPRVRPVT